MQEAVAHILSSGETQAVDPAAYANLVALWGRAGVDVTCPACGQPVSLNNLKGLEGFRVELASHAEEPPAFPFWFRHRAGNGGASCSRYHPSEKNEASPFRARNTFSALEKQKNLAVLNAPAIRAALEEVQRCLMKPLTCHTLLKPEDKRHLQRIERGLVSMAGLAAHSWVLPYMTAVLAGAQERPYGTTTCRVRYKGLGEQSLPFMGADGQDRRLVVPQTIRLFYADPALSDAQLFPNDNKPVTYEVSREAAMTMVRTAMRRHPWAWKSLTPQIGR